MTKTYKYSLSLSPEELLDLVKTKLSGFDFHGNSGNGRISGKGFEGEYRASPSDRGSDLIIIISKPFLVPWIVVKKGLDSAFEKYI